MLLVVALVANNLGKGGGLTLCDSGSCDHGHRVGRTDWQKAQGGATTGGRAGGCVGLSGKQRRSNRGTEEATRAEDTGVESYASERAQSDRGTHIDQ